MTDHINRLKDLTAHLAPTLTDFVTSDAPARVYLTLSGRLVGMHVYSDCEMAVCRLMALPGTEMGPHKHENEVEVLGIISGHCTYVLKNEDDSITEKELHKGDTITILPGIVHSCTYHELTLQWAISMPPAPGFPLPGTE